MRQVIQLIIAGVLLAVVMVTPVQSQDAGEPERGEIRDTEFIIRKDRVLSLPKQSRVFEKSPVLPPVTTSTDYTYQVNDYFFPLAPVALETKPYQKPFPKPETDQTTGIARVGFGNYSSPLFQLDLFPQQYEEAVYGLHLKHEGYYTGPVDGQNSGEDHTDLFLNGSLYKDIVEIYGKLGYERDMYHFYGYTPQPENEVLADTIQQVFNTIHTQIGLRRVEKAEPFNYSASVSLRLFNDRYEAEESEALIKAAAGFRANENLNGGIETELAFTSPSDVNYEAINRNYFKLYPYVQYIQEGLQVRVGANVVHENDIVPNKLKEFYVLPVASISYQLMPEFGIFATYEGDVKRNTYYDFIRENPFLGPSEQLRNTLQNFQVNAGISGNANDLFNYRLGLKYGDFTNMHFYGNNVLDSTRFQLIYDNNTKVMEYHGNLNYNFDEIYSLDASLHYYQYTLDEIGAAWHRPEWEVRVNNSFTPDERWTIYANLHALGGIKAVNLASDTERNLDPLLDLHVHANYAFSSRFSAFLKGNNLLNQQYERFNYYPVRSIQVIGGIGFKF
ncbi:TonB-dependent receptor [Cyclobacterium jeungdonense]|uniref:TonB-dependent receptor n=1 Tax=Cyclobacterium jeungdonense TaxID=708087 RepID=A0ABT8CBL7_9BACT|nr:TonB-dependent receptor [Cyclobacterium jeungdonense]MDN3690204.1 TonB-dependent receptor [Cyclobacterium jeungdonense]